MPDVFDVPLDVTTENDAVVILGPDSVAVALTPAAAEASARLLQEAAAKARGA